MALKLGRFGRQRREFFRHFPKELSTNSFGYPSLILYCMTVRLTDWLFSKRIVRGFFWVSVWLIVLSDSVLYACLSDWLFSKIIFYGFFWVSVWLRFVCLSVWLTDRFPRELSTDFFFIRLASRIVWPSIRLPDLTSNRKLLKKCTSIPLCRVIMRERLRWRVCSVGEGVIVKECTLWITI